ncbi:hypothetical protein AWH62_08485 [Maricaulis sp. W15]|uniref:MarR family winged helix-turn-helix transcriptional regulator n=1 Tax=Maricaulis sp. W15 TaxID=1772333 RepID=UPI000948EC23|nr:MarR family transcriptional regulator [Maricaulis sp. W15]OLF72984.1 hypothetical protein AWH62_08485 [Maricaulis sp. W15]
MEQKISSSIAKIGAWVALNRAWTRISGAVEAQLKRAGHPPLAWYDVLWELEKADACCLRPIELEARLLIRQHNLSRLLTRMATAGLVKKLSCPEDGRSLRIELTPAGRQTRKAMWEVYQPALDAALEGLAPAEARQLAEQLDRLGK